MTYVLLAAKPSVTNSHTSTAPLQLLFTNVWGPSLTISRDGFCYYLSFIEDYSRFTWIFSLKCKFDVLSVFISFKSHVETLLNTKMRALQFDWDGEFCSLYRLSCPYAHSQNGIVQCKHRHIVEISLALLAHSSIPTLY